MTDHEYAFLCRVCSEESMSLVSLFPFEAAMVDTFASSGLVDVTIGGDVLATPLAFTALNSEKDRRDRIEQLRKDAADQQAAEEEHRRSQESQRAVELKQSRKHDYLVAIFGAIAGSLATLLVEHANEFFEILLDYIKPLLQ